MQRSHLCLWIRDVLCHCGTVTIKRFRFLKKKKIPEILYVRVQSIEHFCFVCFESCLKFHGRKSSWKPLNSLLIFKIKAFLCSVFASSRRCINILNAYALKLLPFLQQLTIYPVEWFGVAVEHIKYAMQTAVPIHREHSAPFAQPLFSYIMQKAECGKPDWSPIW